MPFPISRLDDLLLSTTIWGSTGSQFDRIARYYGMPRPAAINRENWRQAVLAVARSERGVPGTTMRFLLWALRQYMTEVDVTVDSANPNRITAASGAPFQQYHVGLYVWMLDRLFLVSGPADVAASGAGAYLELVPVETAFWAAAYWPSLLDTLPHSTTARMVPFWVREPSGQPIFDADGDVTGIRTSTDRVDCCVEVVVDPNATDITVPPSYLMPDASPRPGNMPDGAQLLPNAIIDGNQDTGPWPLYLGGGISFGTIETVLDAVLVAGVKARFVSRADA